MKRLGKLEGKTIVSNKESKLRINEIELDSLGGGDDGSSSGGASGLDMSNFVKFFLIKNNTYTKNKGICINVGDNGLFVCNTENPDGVVYKGNFLTDSFLYSVFRYDAVDCVYAYEKTSGVWCDALLVATTDYSGDERLIAIIDLDGRYTTLQQSVDFINANADKYAWAIEAMQKFKDALTTGAFTTTEA